MPVFPPLHILPPTIPGFALVKLQPACKNWYKWTKKIMIKTGLEALAIRSSAKSKTFARIWMIFLFPGTDYALVGHVNWQ